MLEAMTYVSDSKLHICKSIVHIRTIIIYCHPHLDVANKTIIVKQKYICKGLNMMSVSPVFSSVKQYVYTGDYGNLINQLAVIWILPALREGGRRPDGSQGHFIKQSALLMKYFFVKIFIDLQLFCAGRSEWGRHSAVPKALRASHCKHALKTEHCVPPHSKEGN